MVLVMPLDIYGSVNREKNLVRHLSISPNGTNVLRSLNRSWTPPKVQKCEQGRNSGLYLRASSQVHFQLQMCQAIELGTVSRGASLNSQR